MNWDELLSVFGTNDGSLPDIELNNLSGEEVIRGYAFVRDHSGCISSTGHYYWSIANQCEVPFSYEDNPAEYVVSGKAESFHVCFDGVKSPSGKRVPELGLFVFADSLSFDYRMGAGWNEEALQGLFEMILCLSEGSERMEVLHKTNIFDEDGAIFESYWNAVRNA